jgi:hypothetical protein
MRRRRAVLMGVAATPLAVVAALAAAPEGSLRCADPVLRSVSPDGTHELTVCPRRSWRFAMPGQGSDVPGWVVLRDRDGRIAGVVDVGVMLEIDQPAEWDGDVAVLPLAARIEPFPRDLPTWRRAIDDRRRRLAAHLGLVPRSEDFR